VRYFAIGSVSESVLIVAFFLVPFSHLWGTLPPQPVVADAGGGSSSLDWPSALSVALIFGAPSLLPFAVLARPPACDRLPRASLFVSVGAVALVLLPALVSLSTYPCRTSDVLDYVNRQRLWVVYAENPFRLVPNDHLEDWSFYFANFKNLPFSYAPVWWLVARLFTQWASSLDQYLLGFKALALVCFGVSAGLICTSPTSAGVWSAWRSSPGIRPSWSRGSCGCTTTCSRCRWCSARSSCAGGDVRVRRCWLPPSPRS
jgi:hypothetical protein